MTNISMIMEKLSHAAELDTYLVDVSKRAVGHEFLGGATQGCYVRMIMMLASLYKLEGRNQSDVRVLDWGTGKGHISYLLKKAGFNVTSCDLDENSNDSSFGQDTPILTEQEINVLPLKDPISLPFHDGEFDLVVSFGVLEHVARDSDSLKEIHRILKADGMFFFSFLPYWFSWTQRLAHLRGDWYHPRLYKVSTLKQMARSCGFSLAGIWHGQLFPKNSFPHSNIVERLDRSLTWNTPLKFFATNLEGLLIAEKRFD